MKVNIYINVIFVAIDTCISKIKMSQKPTILCTPCLKEDKTVDAIKYCVECNENFCRHCLKNHIKEFASASTHHRLLNRDEMPEWMCGTSESSTCCTRHTDNQLDSYCEDHDLVCCGACVVIEHSLCEHVRDLVPVANDDGPKSETDVLIQDLKFMMDAMRTLKESRLKDRANLRKTTAKSLSRVREFRQRINDMFNELEKVAVDEIDTECLEEEHNIESDLKQNDNTVTLLGMAVKRIQETDEKTDTTQAEANLITLNGNKLLKDTRKVYQNIQKKSSKTVNFKVNEKLERYVSALTSLGSCNRKANVNIRAATNTSMKKHLIDTGGDLESHDFQDVIQTESSSFLLLDAENRTIVHLDDAFAIIQTYSLDDKSTGEDIYDPFALCLIDIDKLAVSLTHEKAVRIYYFKERLELLKEIKTVEYCRGLAYSTMNEEMFVGCGGGSFSGEGLGHIRVYNLQGDLLRSIKLTSDGKILSPRPMHLAMDNDGSKLFIADSMKGIIATDTDGNVLGTFTAPELDDPRGISVDVNDDVIVCGHVSNTVIRINKDMKRYDVLMTEANGVCYPVSLCYDTIQSKCIVLTGTSNEICDFDL